ncbi:hypothetical protein BOX15_Mlig023777g1 [Macrostomum lignano]|uniref:Death domain-containing protein n=1 Tax=Macrostomum lignano TaxID=282301 RepID=A0A267G6A7_9PLAT|nr:hypothetical protein BOX15_Mlig004088g1 [Macrostomum lignano]PAA81551.1 hypothetical protein BOX15_Mlig023777g1 [Macrostomum lignano]
MELKLQQVMERHAKLPVWCLSRANLALVADHLNAQSVATPTWDGREYTSDLLGLFELLNVRYMEEKAELTESNSNLNWVLRKWLQSSPQQATLRNLFECLRLLQRTDIMQRLDSRLFVEYYHVYVGYHQSDAGKAKCLIKKLKQLEPRWILLDSQMVSSTDFPVSDVVDRCFISVLLVSQQYLAECSDYWRLLIQQKYRNYPTFCITVDAATVRHLPSGMKLFPTLSWSLLEHTPNFFSQLQTCVSKRSRAVSYNHHLLAGQP